MNVKNILIYLTITIFSLGFFGCEEPVGNSEDLGDATNTLNEPSIGSGIEGHVNDYFYDFSENFNIKFYRHNYFSLKTGVFNPEEDTLNFKNFGDYLLEVTHKDTSLGYTELIFDSTNVDTLTDSVTVSSVLFMNVDSLVWNEMDEWEPQYQSYATKQSEYLYDDTTVAHDDEINYVFYHAMLDSMITEGSTIIDTNEWGSHSNVVLGVPDTFTATFIFNRSFISGDSLIFRRNTDCNDNGEWDGAEVRYDDILSLEECESSGYNWDTDLSLCFEDKSNGVWDDHEPFIDRGQENPERFGFQDRNCNGKWDDAEEIVVAGTENASWDVDHEIWFIDRGNGVWDDAELVTEVTIDGDTTYDELFTFGRMANNLLVSYEEDTTIILDIINIGDSLVARWPYKPGEDPVVFNDIIVDSLWKNEPIDTVSNIDSIITIFTNKVVGNFSESESSSGNYFITKTVWEETDPVQGILRDYDYHIFNITDNIYERIYPSYFKPDGFWTGDKIEGADREDPASVFWFEENAVDEILYYTPGNYFRDGERVVTDLYNETPVADYYIVKSYAVDADTVTIPLNGGTFFSKDSCFKITREVTMIMLGSAVEYGERNITWLAKDFGIVKDEVSYRWNEAPEWMGIEDLGWVELSKLELAEYRVDTLGRSLPKSFMGLTNSVHLEDFKNMEEFDNDPYKITRTFGLQRIEPKINQ